MGNRKPFIILLSVITALILGATFLLANFSKSQNQTAYANTNDYAGIRTQKNVSGNITNYLVEGSRILGEETNGNLTWYYYDESGVSGMRYQNVDYVFEKNILGDVVGIYRANDRAYMGGYYYDAWGNAYYSGTYTWVVDVNPFRYRGYYWDIQTGLYYLQSRYYDSRTGRFLNADNPENLYYTADLTGGANLYSYCLNNPVMMIDSTGENPFLVFAFIAVASLLTTKVINYAVGYEPSIYNWEDWAEAILCVIPGVGVLKNVGKGVSVVDKYLDVTRFAQKAEFVATKAAAKANNLAPFTYKAAIKSLHTKPNQWIHVGTEVAQAGTKYKGGISIYKAYQHTGTKQIFGTHTITVNGFVKHQHHKFFKAIDMLF